MDRALSTREQLMLDVAHEVLLLVDEQLNVVTLNRAAAKFFGERAQVGALLTDLTDSDELETTFRYIIANREQDFEVQTKINDRFCRVRTRLHVDDDDALFVGVALQDVTELVRLNRARRDMVANISHELRNPVAKIRLIIDTLFYEADKPKRKKSIQSLREIARETDSLQWIVQEMLDLSMIESGQSIVRMVDVPIGEMIQEAIERMTEQAQSNRLSLTAKVEDDLIALCDRDLAQRVLINLLHNAMKFSPAGEKVTVRARSEGEFIVITVQDRGPGVPADQTDRIFERFYQVDESRSRSEGTGLGLAICKHIVDAHGGQVWAEPTEEAGGGLFAFSLLNANFDHDALA